MTTPAEPEAMGAGGPVATAIRAKPPRARHYAIYLVILVAGLFRFAGIQSIPPGSWQDETLVLSQTADIIERGRWHLHVYEDEPLYGVFAVAGCLIGGVTPQGLRLGSAIAGVLTVAALYWFALGLWGRRTALVAAFILAVLPWHVIFSRIGFRGVTLPLCVALSAGCFDRAVRQRRGWYFLPLGATLAAGAYSYIPFKLMYPVLLTCWLSLRRQARRAVATGAAAAVVPRRRNWLFAAVGAALLAAGMIPAALMLRDAPLLHERVTAESNLTLGLLLSGDGPAANALKVAGMFVWRGDPLPRHNTPSAAQIPRVLFPFLLIGLVGAARRARTPRNTLVLALFVAFLLPSVFSRSAPHALRCIGAVVPVALLCARGAMRTWCLVRARSRMFASSRRLRALAASAAAALLLGVGAWTYFVSYARNDMVWQSFQAGHAAGARLVMGLPPDAVVMHEPFLFGRTTFDYLTRERAARIKTVSTAQDLQRWASVRPLYMLFIGKDRLGGEFLRIYPDARRIAFINTPGGVTTGVLFEVP